MKIYTEGKEGYCFVHDGKDHVLRGYGTDHMCCWLSIVNALEAFSGTEQQSCDIYLNSLFVYKQLTFEYRIKDQKLKDIYLQFVVAKNNVRDRVVQFFYVSGVDNPARQIYENRRGLL